ncbi:MAG: hypothetical protein PHE17_07670 [Thiothrix sp.]|uniref:hypothetical protein n=1 Tax=Thiothrix sp. TaxID=1032 RepID=UPI00261EB19C|nr:hypothetical protein [Thiothrix sp.]MDD5392883.1 hypothetical protein [Thiothrix sp.]
MSSGFPSLTGAQEEMEEGFWSSFSNVMMVILKIFLLVIVMMALNNRNLLDDLKHSVKAKEAAQVEAQKSAQDAQKAAQVAEFQLKENATLEEQLDYLQQRSTALEMELLSSRAETEQARSLNTDKETELTRLQALAREQADSLSLREQSLNALQTELSSKNAEISGLYTKVDESEKKLLSMNGSYAELDKKYQKLLKPARSSKGKQVVEVVYQKGGYGIRKPGEAGQRSVGRDVLESELAGLKAQYGTDLYVKVIIPDNSGLSYNEAWRFTNDMLSKYDYYHQPDGSVPAPR